MPQIIKIVGQRRRPLPPREFMGFQLDKNDRYNGQPLTHWLTMADELVMSTIVRGINPDKLSLVQTVAAERLRGLAMALNPNLYYATIEERDRCRAAIPRMVSYILGHDRLPPCDNHKPSKKKSKSRKRK